MGVQRSLMRGERGQIQNCCCCCCNHTRIKTKGKKTPRSEQRHKQTRAKSGTPNAKSPELGELGRGRKIGGLGGLGGSEWVICPKNAAAPGARFLGWTSDDGIPLSHCNNNNNNNHQPTTYYFLVEVLCSSQTLGRFNFPFGVYLTLKDLDRRLVRCLYSRCRCCCRCCWRGWAIPWKCNYYLI